MFWGVGAFVAFLKSLAQPDPPMLVARASELKDRFPWLPWATVAAGVGLIALGMRVLHAAIEQMSTNLGPGAMLGVVGGILTGAALALLTSRERRRSSSDRR